MKKYIKPTISLAATGTTTAAASTCTTGTVEAKSIEELLVNMGYDINTAFGMYETCTNPVMFEEYCKFSSSIQIFYS